MVYEPALNQIPRENEAHIRPIAIDTLLSGATHLVDQDIEQIILWINDYFNPEQIIKAKEDFYWKSGKVFSHEEFFHQRMSYFIDQYVFTRILEESDPKFRGKTPYEAYTSDPTLPQLHTKSFRHSIFIVTKASQNSITIKDLMTKQKSTLHNRPSETFTGIEKKFIFQGFYYTVNEKNFLSHGLIFHPKNCHRVLRSLIRKHLNSSNQDDSRFLSAAAKAQLQNLRHPNIDSTSAYKDNLSF